MENHANYIICVWKIEKSLVEKKTEKKTETEVGDSELITGHFNIILIFDCNNWDFYIAHE